MGIGLDSEIHADIKAGDWSGALNHSSYHLPFVGAGRNSWDAWQTGHPWQAAGHAGLFGAEVFGLRGVGLRGAPRGLGAGGAGKVRGTVRKEGVAKKGGNATKGEGGGVKKAGVKKAVNSSGKGMNQIPKYATFRADWESKSCKEAIQKFVPNAKKIASEDGKKIIYINEQTGVKIIYDKNGHYFRIKDCDNYHLNWEGRRVHRLKGMNDKSASAHVQKNTHFNDVD